jgi:hypothetical protein
MSQSGRSFDPTQPPPSSGPVVDYRLARRSLISSVRRGLVPTIDVCDAHPELMRAGKNIGAETETQCPICSHDSLRVVRYVYGDKLGRNNGRVVYPEGWLQELVREHPSFTCYTVEVCIDCAWNHLLRSFVVGTDHRSVGGPRETRRSEQG